MTRGGAFAAGATPAIVFFRWAFGRGAPPGRGMRDPVSLFAFRPSIPTTAPMRKLLRARTEPDVGCGSLRDSPKISRLP